MKNKFTTIILFIIMVILIVGVLIFGVAIYIDFFEGENAPSIYKIDNIATEEPTQNNKDLENAQQSISNSIQSILNSNSTNQPISNTTTNKYINKFFYNQLNENQKIIYKGLEDNKDNLKQGNYKITFESNFSDILSKENGSEELGRDYQTAIEAFTHDNPEIFYIDVNKMYLNIETVKKILTTTYNVYISPAQGSTYLADEFSDINQIENGIAAIEKIKDIILSNLKGTNYDKILFIHDYLINNIEYDSSYQQVGSYSVYGALIGKKCVCEGYAKAFKYLANAAGFECELMQGTATNSNGKTESHAWNCIKLNGTWYEIDVTWDDPIIIGGGKVSQSVKYQYFLKGKSTFEKDHILSYQFSDNGKNFSYPYISENDY